MTKLECKVSVTDTDVFKELAKEVVFLRYFYKAAADGFGPASSDLYDMIRENYNGEIPEGY